MSDESLKKRVVRAVKRPVRFVAKDWALGFAFPRAYRAAVAKTEVDGNKVLFVDVKSSSMPDAFSVMQAALVRRGYDVRFVGLGQNEGIGWGAYYRNCLQLMADLATAAYVFLADACDVVSCIDLRPETRVVQLWHACGAFKKFGVSTADLKFGGSRKEVQRHPFYRNLSLVTVSAAEVEWAYREAMMLEDSPQVVKALGVSRTDVFFDEEFLAQARDVVFQAVPAAQGKRVLLYAPTFRGKVSEAEGPDALDWRALRAAVGEDWVVLVKHHPFVKELPGIPDDCRDFAFHVPDVPTDCLYVAADALMTDYSSVVFEYSLFERPMLFFAYDKEDYDDWRGFYYDYDEFTPGPVVRTTEDVIDCLARIDEQFEQGGRARVRAFRGKFMSACDGHATERICDAMGMRSEHVLARADGRARIL